MNFINYSLSKVEFKKIENVSAILDIFGGFVCANFKKRLRCLLNSAIPIFFLKIIFGHISQKANLKLFNRLKIL